MNKKSVSATILILFMALCFSVVGTCFYTFVYDRTRTLVTAVGVINDENIQVFSDEKLKRKVSGLKLSNMDIGLKPATGEVDSETQIPSTIDDKGTSEGYYSTVYVVASGKFRIQLNNIQIKSDHDAELIEEEKKNIFVGIMDLKNSVKTLENDGIEICRYVDVSSEPIKITFLIWLGSLASDELEGARISFDIKFVSI